MTPSHAPSPSPSPDLYAELRATRRELQAARRALQLHAVQRVAQRGAMTREDTVRALSVVLQHTTPPALEDLRAERDAMARDLGSVQARLRSLQAKYTALRYNAWHVAARSLHGEQPHDDALDEICRLTEDSEDDRGWERRG
jgi:hypothetical protein